MKGGQYISFCTSIIATGCKPKYFEVRPRKNAKREKRQNELHKTYIDETSALPPYPVLIPKKM